uniref:Secreted protein n=1 Tax=Heterorhabditis bacteriophora TaxID=37862 RepID=A0A1I7WAS6_HETBA
MSCCLPHCQFEICISMIINLVILVYFRDEYGVFRIIVQICSLHSTLIPNQPMPVSKDISVCKPAFYFIQGNMSSFISDYKYFSHVHFIGRDNI